MSRDAEDVMVSSNKEGIDKVLRDQGGYAFFMESTTIEYVTERYCQLQQVGGLLDSKSYGIAVQQGKNFLYFKNGSNLIIRKIQDLFYQRVRRLFRFQQRCMRSNSWE